MARSRNTAAFAKALQALRAEGRLDDRHEALVAAARSLSEAVDAAPGSDAMWREYRLALKALMEAASSDAGNVDEDEAFLDAVRTPVGDPTVN